MTDIGDTKRRTARGWLLTFGATLIAALALHGCGRSSMDLTSLLQPNSGGNTTVHDATRHAYSRPAANIDTTQRAEFAVGNAFFNSPWIVAPASPCVVSVPEARPGVTHAAVRDGRPR